MLDLNDMKKGFWVAVGVLVALLLWSLVTGTLGHLAGGRGR